MRTMTTALLAVLMGLAGCTRESNPGGPGVGNGRDNDKTTFTLSVPRTATGITQGKSEAIKVSLNRGEAFKESVELTFKPPLGLKVVPESVTIRSGESDTTVNVQAAEDAQPDKAKIQITAKPAVGKSTSEAIEVEVEEKE